MRKSLEAVALATLLLMWGITGHALVGPNRLPSRIPTHFDLAGHVDGWGAPWMLWFFPLGASFLYLLISVVARFPGAFNYPVRVTAQNHLRLQNLALNMIAWIKAEVLCLFAWIQYEIIQSARQGKGTLAPAVLPIVLVCVFGTIAWYIVAMRRAAREG